MTKLKVAINGFGRIGRAFYKLASEREEIEIVAINDLGDIENLAYLLRNDSIYGKWDHDVVVSAGKISVDGKESVITQEREPAKLPWGAMGVDVVVESTGFFTEFSKARCHLDAGAKRVVISAPAKGDPVPGIESGTVLMGVNEEKLATCQITSNGSCTTNATSPVIQVLHEAFGVKKAMLSTTHSYTASQSLVDSPKLKDWREGRAAG